jgi:hypothetical protein
MEGGCVVQPDLFFEMGGFDPDEVEFLSASHGAALEDLDDREVAVMKRDVFSYQYNRHCLEETVLLHGKVLLFNPSCLVPSNQSLNLWGSIKHKDLAHQFDKASTKGSLSISPTVPPNSMIHTSGVSFVSLTGILASHSIQS